MVTVLALGKTIERAKQLTGDDVLIALGGFPEKKRHCSLRGTNALLAAIEY
jgi:nitrogen fixation protein NifU and related proteins